MSNIISNNSLRVLIFNTMFIVLASQSITFAQNSSSQAIFILQDIVDNFEHGLFAGGTYEAQGNDFGGFSIVQDVAHEGSHSLLFETDEDGFSRPNIEAEDNFISLTKTFLLSPYRCQLVLPYCILDKK